MPKRSSNKGLDVVQNARHVVEASISGSEEAGLPMISNPSLVSRIMAEMGRRGGQIGGKRRLETMTAARRKAVASQAAKARWSKVKKSKKR